MRVPVVENPRIDPAFLKAIQVSGCDKIRQAMLYPNGCSLRDEEKGTNSRLTSNERTIFAEMTPFRIEPRFVGRVWGWKDLHPWYDRVATEEPIGEVWLTGDDCCAATGQYAGKTLSAIF